MNEQYGRSTCKSCGAPIIWAVAERSLKSIPVDAAPAADGNIQLVSRTGQAPYARVLKVADRFGKKCLRLAHFVTCPNAASHRRAGRRSS